MVDLFSDNLDPSITKRLCESIGIRNPFPKIQGIATACYALQIFPHLSLDDAVQHYIACRKTPAPVYQISHYEEVDLFSHDIDPFITKELCESIGIGNLFPKIQGIATACYALQRYPELSLEEAVPKYIEYLNKPKPVYEIPKTSAYHHVKKVDGVSIVDWDNNREGYHVTKVYASNYHQKDGNGINMNVSFVVKNEDEAIQLCRKIIEAVKADINARPYVNSYGIKRIHFSGPMAFISGNP